MTTFSAGYVTANSFNNASTANFRAWGKAVSDAMTAVGLTKTSDTGQIDWSTVNLPAASAYGGYEIRRMSDALDTTYPMFIKFEFGTVTTGARWVIRITVSSGTDGAGNPTGILMSPFPIGTNAQMSAANTTLMMCRTQGVWWMAVIPSASDCIFLAAITRSQNAAGVYGEDFTMLAANSSSWITVAPTALSVDRSAVVSRSSTTDFFFLPWYGSASATATTRLITAPVFCYPQLAASEMAVLFRTGEYTPYTTFTAAPVAGRSHTYFATPLSSTSPAGNYAFIWE